MRLGPVKCCVKVSCFFSLDGRNASSNDRFQTPLFDFFACFVLVFCVLCFFRFGLISYCSIYLPLVEFF